jgi:hypothetical protein
VVGGNYASHPVFSLTKLLRYLFPILISQKLIPRAWTLRSEVFISYYSKWGYTSHITPVRFAKKNISQIISCFLWESYETHEYQMQSYDS